MNWKEAGYPSNAFTIVGTTYIITGVNARDGNIYVLSERGHNKLQYNNLAFIILKDIMRNPNTKWSNAILIERKIIVIEWK